ncbi:MAG TPA: DivIVA domain-containing protein [Acidimicrobiales bacterium]|jgi:cell division initiation protein|nr:DivIVA domain-containing protein [Acidimicrobiales bacterium]
MDTTTTQSALDALRTAEFRLSLRGYDVDEVDDFLERAAVEADQLREQVRQSTAQATQAAERVRHLEVERPSAAPTAAAPAVPVAKGAAAGATAGTVTKMIEMAERFVEQTRLDAEAEAARIVADAQDRARQLATDAQQRLADEVARLEGLRQRLGEDVEKMSTQLESERMRLSGSLHDLLGWIDKNLQPAAALAALRSGVAGTPTNGQSGGSAQVLSMDDARREE